MALFADRTHAGHGLARALTARAWPNAVVVGIPRGGVVVAASVAEDLGLPLTAVAVRKIGSPRREEYAVGAIAPDVRLIDDCALRHEGVTRAQLAIVEAKEQTELARRSALFAGRHAVRGRTALVVDDGIATGATALVACRSCRVLGAHEIILAVPVAPARWDPPADAADDYVCPHREDEFWAVGSFYDDFAQTTDAEVVELLARDLRIG